MNKRFILSGILMAVISIAFGQNVGINETNPGSKFSVNGNTSIGASYSALSAPNNGLIIQGKTGIGTNVPDTSAILDLSSTSGGLLLPRMTAAQRNAIVTPANGLMVFDTDSSSLYYYGSGWHKFGASSSPTGVAGGDLTGSYPNPTLGNTGVAASTYGSVTSVPQITINAEGRITSATSVVISGVTPGGTAGGDLLGTYPNPTVAKVNGATVPASGSLVTGRVLQVSGTSALTYAAVNLAGGSNYVTGNLPVANGGTGAATASAHTFFGNFTGSTAAPSFGSPTLASGDFANEGDTGQVLHGNASGNPSWGKVNLGSQVTNVLPVTSGGTGLTTLTNNNVILGNGTSTPTFVAPGASGNVLTSDGSTWISAATSSITGVPTYALVTSDQNATGTLANISGLSIALAKNTTYEIEAVLIVSSTNGHGDTNYGVNYTGTGTNTLNAYISGTYDFAAGGHTTTQGLTAFNTASANNYLNTSSTGGIIIKGTITTGGTTAGNLTIEQVKGSGTSTVYKGSYLKVTKIQ